MIIYTSADTEKDLQGILALQKANLPVNLSGDEMQSQGFVTVNHTYPQLLNLNNTEKHIIAKDGEKVIAYLLAMTKAASNDIPILVPMFDMFGEVQYAGKPVSGYNYMVVGQVCVDKEYRGQGILDECYATYKRQFSPRYDFAITEIATTNRRSINAHQRIGFKEVYQYTAPDGVEWSMVLWDWKGQ